MYCRLTCPTGISTVVRGHWQPPCATLTADGSVDVMKIVVKTSSYVCQLCNEQRQIYKISQKNTHLYFTYIWRLLLFSSILYYQTCISTTKNYDPMIYTTQSWVKICKENSFCQTSWQYCNMLAQVLVMCRPQIDALVQEIRNSSELAME